MSSDKFISRAEEFNRLLIDAKSFKEKSKGGEAIQAYSEAKKIYDSARLDLDRRFLPNTFALAIRDMGARLRDTYEKMQQTQYPTKSSETLRRLPE